MDGDQTPIGNLEIAIREMDDARIEQQEMTELTVMDGPSLSEMLQDAEFERDLNVWWDEQDQSIDQNQER
jgi:hypothetical protein